MIANGRLQITSAAILTAVSLPQAAYADPARTVSVSSSQPMTLEQIRALVETQLGKPVKITLSPEREYLRSDAGRRLAITWNGPVTPFLNAVAQRFGLQWREDPPAIQIFDDARLVPAPLPLPAPAPVAAAPAAVDAVPKITLTSAQIEGSSKYSSPAPLPTASAAPRGSDVSAPPRAIVAATEPLTVDPLKKAAGDWADGNYELAVGEWSLLARDDNPDALFNLGQAARLGRGMPQDTSLATDFYKRAAAQGHRKAAAFLDRMTVASGRSAVSSPTTQLTGLWAIHLGTYGDMQKALKAFSRILKREPLSGFPVRFSPNGADYEITVDQLTPAFATQTCQRLTRKLSNCRVLGGQ